MNACTGKYDFQTTTTTATTIHINKNIIIITWNKYYNNITLLNEHING